MSERESEREREGERERERERERESERDYGVYFHPYVYFQLAHLHPCTYSTVSRNSKHSWKLAILPVVSQLLGESERKRESTFLPLIRTLYFHLHVFDLAVRSTVNRSGNSREFVEILPVNS